MCRIFKILKLNADEIMAYMAGLVASDGTLSSANFYRVKIITSNRNFANLITDLFKRINANPRIYSYNGRKFEVYCYNKELWWKLHVRFQIPCGRKSALIHPPRDLKFAESLSFLRGLLDGDSSIFILKTILRREQSSYSYLMPRIAYKSKSPEIVLWSLELLKELRMTPYLANDVKAYRWHLDGLPNMRKFYTRLGYMHPEKNLRLKHILMLGRGQAYYIHIRPPEKERVTAHPPRLGAPKIDGPKRAAETPGHPADAGWR